MSEWEYMILVQAKAVSGSELVTRAFEAGKMRTAIRRGVNTNEKEGLAKLEDLNALGAQGWELIGVADSLGMDQDTFYLKRPRQETASRRG